MTGSVCLMKLIFGTGGEEFKEFNRGIEGNNRVCVSDWLVTDKS